MAMILNYSERLIKVVIARSAATRQFREYEIATPFGLAMTCKDDKCVCIRLCNPILAAVGEDIIFCFFFCLVYSKVAFAENVSIKIE